MKNQSPKFDKFGHNYRSKAARKTRSQKIGTEIILSRKARKKATKFERKYGRLYR